MKYIEKLKLHNFCRFKDLTIDFDNSLNLLIGDNESGKSTILNAIDLVLSGNRNKVESYGLENLFNSNVIETFLRTKKDYSDLPTLYIELFLNDLGNKDLEGKNNSLGIKAHGLYLICEPRQDLGKEIVDILNQKEDNFPFEYYSIVFKTFSGDSYSGYKKYLNHVILDNTQINNEYATKSYIKTLYQANIIDDERNKHQNEYRRNKDLFKDKVLSGLNSRITDYTFAIRTNSKSNLEADLTIREGKIDIENKGKGRQCFIKTDFALRKSAKELDVILLEEPENHLSHVNMKKLILKIIDTVEKQLFIATHSNLISSRLDLRKSILLNSNNDQPTSLNKLDVDTAKFFIKAPDNNILEYILSRKVILVEGDAEYILMEQLYENITKAKLESSDIHIISVGGTSFKRYLDVAKLLNIKTAVIRDNDGDYKKKITESFSDYKESFIKIFADMDDKISTFEIAMYNSNTRICEDLFSTGRKSLSVQDYMLSNKAKCALELLDKKGSDLVPPDYIMEAIDWIRK